MRALAIVAPLLVAGCAGAGIGDHAVRVINATDAPATIGVYATDTVTRADAFAHFFDVVQPRQTLTVEHDFRNGRPYEVRAEMFEAMGDGRNATRTLELPASGWSIEVRLDAGPTLTIAAREG